EVTGGELKLPDRRHLVDVEVVEDVGIGVRCGCGGDHERHTARRALDHLREVVDGNIFLKAGAGPLDRSTCGTAEVHDLRDVGLVIRVVPVEDQLAVGVLPTRHEEDVPVRHVGSRASPEVKRNRLDPARDGVNLPYGRTVH